VSKPEISQKILLEFWKKVRTGSCTFRPGRSSFESLLRWGWVFLERTRILSGIQFTTYFIEIFLVETKQFVSSFVNVTLTRQTCGQRSSTGVASTRRVIGNYFSGRICYMFIISKFRGDQDLCLCTNFGQPQRHGKIRKKRRHMT